MTFSPYCFFFFSIAACAPVLILVVMLESQRDVCTFTFTHHGVRTFSHFSSWCFTLRCGMLGDNVCEEISLFFSTTDKQLACNIEQAIKLYVPFAFPCCCRISLHMVTEASTLPPCSVAYFLLSRCDSCCYCL